MINSDLDFKKQYQTFLQNAEIELDKIGVFKNSKIAVGLSGGVDSAANLAILKELGFNVFAITMKIWNPKYEKIFQDISKNKTHGCFGPEEIEDINDIITITKQLNTELYIIDLVEEYQQILDYFKNEYFNGRTPNPCVKCNWQMKFEHLLEKAIQSKINFDYFSTGHYVKKIIYKGLYTLAKANYLKKDQSYYLSYLNQKHFEKSIFPLGYIENKEFTRKIAKYYNLKVYNKPDSQNFISSKYIEIFKNQPIENGLIKDKTGKILGFHKGIHLYTIGQRKGIGLSSSKPLYVINIDSSTNTIVVGEKEDLYQKKLIARNLNWIIPEFENLSAKIRYTHEPTRCVVKKIDQDIIEVEFYEKQLAITPGQIISFYNNDILIGAATIDKVIMD